MTLKWKTDWGLGRYSGAGLEVGRVGSRLRLQDLQIKGKPEKGGKKSMCAESPVLVDLQPGTLDTISFFFFVSVERIMHKVQTMYGSCDFPEKKKRKSPSPSPLGFWVSARRRCGRPPRGLPFAARLLDFPFPFLVA